MSNKPEVPAEVEDAIRTLIRWAGDDPEREGAARHPEAGRARVEGICQGYDEDPGKHLARVFEEVGGYE